MDEKAVAEIPPSVASTVDQTEPRAKQRPAPETDRATVPQKTNAKAELQASQGAKSSAEAFGSRGHAAGTPEPGDDLGSRRRRVAAGPIAYTPSSQTCRRQHHPRTCKPQNSLPRRLR